MAGHSTYIPKRRFARWLDDRLPILRCERHHDDVPDAAEPELLVLVRRHSHLLPGDADRHRHRAGDALRAERRTWPSTSVENIMRDVNYGWLLRYMHANGASMFFIAVYLHMFRGLYYGSYKAPREILWIIGVIIYRADDRDRVSRLRAAVGADVVLGGDSDHQSVQLARSAHSRIWALRS